MNVNDYIIDYNSENLIIFHDTNSSGVLVHKQISTRKRHYFGYLLLKQNVGEKSSNDLLTGSQKVPIFGVNIAHLRIMDDIDDIY